jgi:ribonuclease P protein component
VGGIVLFDAPAEPGPPRVAVTAGRPVGKAVDRNRAKRRMREAIARAPIRHGRAYVLVATPAVLDAAFQDLVGWVRSAVEVEDDR